MVKGTNRHEWVAEESIKKILAEDLKVEFADVIKEIKAATKESIFKIIQDKVDRAWSKK